MNNIKNDFFLTNTEPLARYEMPKPDLFRSYKGLKYFSKNKTITPRTKKNIGQNKSIDTQFIYLLSEI